MKLSSTNSPTYNPIPISSISGELTWGDRLLLNLFSYSIILIPIAVIIFATKHKLFPSKVRSSLLIQWFVYGNNLNKATKFKEDAHGDDNKSLLSNQIQSIDNNQSIRNTNFDTKLTFIWCFLGLQVSYLIWGVLQEKIMTTEYEVTNILYDNRFINKSSPTTFTSERSHKGSSHSIDSDNIRTITFHDSQFLVFINRIIAFILSIIALVYNRPRRSTYYNNSAKVLQVQGGANEKPQAPLYEYVYCSLTNILSSWCQYEALKYVNFPTQVLSKSCKIIPVMLMSKLILKKKYQSLDYFCAILLSVGMFIFLLNQPITNIKNHTFGNDNQTKKFSKNEPIRASIHELGEDHSINNKLKFRELAKHVSNNSLISGLVILSLYLAFDSFTSNWQQSLFSRYGISNWQMMAATNFYSILLTLTSLQQLGTLKPAFELMASSRFLLTDCLLMSIMSSFGQLFVYYTIKRFGSVIFAVIMTLRQFLAILLSCTIYKHQLTLGSTAGLVLVFFVIGFQTYNKSGKRNSTATITDAKTKTTSVCYNEHQIRIQFNSTAVK